METVTVTVKGWSTDGFSGYHSDFILEISSFFGLSLHVDIILKMLSFFMNF